MPEIDGLEMTRLIRILLKANGEASSKHASRCTIWAVTAMDEHEIEQQVDSVNGLDGASVKPLHVDNLRMILNHAKL